MIKSETWKPKTTANLHTMKPMKIIFTRPTIQAIFVLKKLPTRLKMRHGHSRQNKNFHKQNGGHCPLLFCLVFSKNLKCFDAV